MRPAYSTSKGRMYQADIEAFITSTNFAELRGQVDLVLTSPPYPLLTPKAYGNKVGDDYLHWITAIMVSLRELLKPNGSLVVEIGNAWDKGKPTMSTLPLETLLAIKNETGLQLCQQFIWHNPNKLPGPATWVNIRRIRVKDSFTNIWWYGNNSEPYADNSQVLVPYTNSMERLLRRQQYNQGMRPSGHKIGSGFLSNNEGAIPASVLVYSNTKESSQYRQWCHDEGVPQHPARMPADLAEFFIKFLTKPDGLVFDPFGGSNTTGSVAELLGRRWVAVERDKQYVKGSKGRFKASRKSKK